MGDFRVRPQSVIYPRGARKSHYFGHDWFLLKTVCPAMAVKCNYTIAFKVLRVVGKHGSLLCARQGLLKLRIQIVLAENIIIQYQCILYVTN